MSYDIVIKNGTIVDGTGRAGYRADLAISQGKIVEIGKVKDGAAKTIDASDLIVSPGFIDPHTHYDGQICWDPLVTASSWHGVTSVVMGNCGVGLAPCRPEFREIATWDLVNVEAIPFEVLNQGLTWDWESFPQFMDAAARRGSGINLGFLAPLTPFRHYVMGEESMERAATAEETGRIRALIKEAVAAGALGFSTTNAPQHIGYKSRPLACRLADQAELKAYASTLKELGKGTIEIIINRRVDAITPEECDLLDMLLTASGRQITWLVLRKFVHAPQAYQEMLRVADQVIKRGAHPQLATMELIGEFSFRQPSLALALYPVVEARFQRDAGRTDGALQRSGISRGVPRGGDQATGPVHQHLESGDGQFREESGNPGARRQDRGASRTRARSGSARHIFRFAIRGQSRDAVLQRDDRSSD